MPPSPEQQPPAGTPFYRLAKPRKAAFVFNDSWVVPACPMPWPQGEKPPLVTLGLRECYQANLAYVEIVNWPLPAGLERDRWIIRGLPLAIFFTKVLLAWQRGDRLAPHFRLRKRLPPTLLKALQDLSPALLPEAFTKLRQEGLLSPLRALTRANWPGEIPWETGRWCFQEWPKSVVPTGD